VKDVFFLTTGVLRAPAHAVLPSLRRPPGNVKLSVTVAVCTRDDGSVVLVDAGLSEDVCARRGLGGALGHAFYGMTSDRNDALAPQLRALGIAPDRVTTILATHLHMDHIGGAADFPRADVHTTTDELVAFSRALRPAAYQGAVLDGIRAVHAVPLEPVPRLGFAASRDVFGDGEIVLLDARGHTAGSVAVAIAAPDGATYLHVGDAVYQRWEVEAERPSLLARAIAWNRREHAATARLLRDLERGWPAARGTLTIVPSHDATVFESLPHAPRTA
jgi:glyoxylase-like metal-dependent hydrolase (beta-lactamase superfamily II)